VSPWWRSSGTAARPPRRGRCSTPLSPCCARSRITIRSLPLSRCAPASSSRAVTSPQPRVPSHRSKRAPRRAARRRG
jgi:hypothetical protein